jgi:hypothetical protein
VSLESFAEMGKSVALVMQLTDGRIPSRLKNMKAVSGSDTEPYDPELPIHPSRQPLADRRICAHEASLAVPDPGLCTDYIVTPTMLTSGGHIEAGLPKLTREGMTPMKGQNTYGPVPVRLGSFVAALLDESPRRNGRSTSATGGKNK